MKYVLTFLLLFPSVSQAAFDLKKYDTSCVANATVILKEIDPSVKKWTKEELASVVVSGCKGTLSRLSNESKKYDADLVGCFDGIQVALFKVDDKHKKKSISDKLFGVYCKQ